MKKKRITTRNQANSCTKVSTRIRIDSNHLSQEKDKKSQTCPRVCYTLARNRSLSISQWWLTTDLMSVRLPSKKRLPNGNHSTITHQKRVKLVHPSSFNNFSPLILPELSLQSVSLRPLASQGLRAHRFVSIEVHTICKKGMTSQDYSKVNKRPHSPILPSSPLSR